MGLTGTKPTQADDAKEECSKECLKNVAPRPFMKWIFVCGKGGVGKTTISCALAARLAKTRESAVLLVSTGPGHSISEVLQQTFTDTPTKVDRFDNLYAMQGVPYWAPQPGPEEANDQGNNFGTTRKKDGRRRGALYVHIGMDSQTEQSTVSASAVAGDKSNDAPMIAPASFEVESDEDEYEYEAPSTSKTTATATATCMKVSEHNVSGPTLTEEDVKKAFTNMFMLNDIVTVLMDIKRMDFSVVVFDTRYFTEMHDLMSGMKAYNERSATVPSVDNNDDLKMMVQLMTGKPFEEVISDDNVNIIDNRKIIELKLRLINKAETSVVSVCVADYLTMRDTAWFLAEMEALGVDCKTVIMNRSTPDSGHNCNTCRNRRKYQDSHVNKLCNKFKDLDVCRVPSVDEELKGVTAIQQLSNYLTPATDSASLRL